MFIPAFNVEIKDGKIVQILRRTKDIEAQTTKEESILDDTTSEKEKYIKDNNKFIEFRKKSLRQSASSSSYMINKLEDMSKKAESVKNAMLKSDKWFYDVVMTYEEGDYIVLDGSYYRKEFSEFLMNFVNYSLYYVYVLSKAKDKNFALRPDNTIVGIRYVDDFDEEAESKGTKEYSQSMKLFAPVILYNEKIRDISLAIHEILMQGDFSAEKLENAYKRAGLITNANYMSEQIFVSSCEFYNELLKGGSDLISGKDTLDKIIAYNSVLSSFYYFDFDLTYEGEIIVNALAKSDETKAEMDITIMSKDKITKKDFYDRISST